MKSLVKTPNFKFVHFELIQGYKRGLHHKVFELKGKELILGILNYKNIRELVKKRIEWAHNNRKEIENKPYPEEPLSHILKIIITRSYWRPWRRDKILKKLRKDKLLINYDELNNVLRAIEEIYEETKKSYWKETLDSLKKFKEGIEKAGSLKNWVDKLYEIVKNGNNWKSDEYFSGIKGLGPKGVNLLLRDMGYFDMVPIDRHERRFLLRTGIVLYYGSPSGDPASYKFYTRALIEFCNEQLKGLEIEGIRLDKAPGAVDWIIWYFACEREDKDCKNICSSNPKCKYCPVKDLCLYGIIH